MSRVFVSPGTGSSVYVFADDHCPPHVHARHRGEGWVARVGFSYVTDRVRLISVVPQRNVPPGRTLSLLLDDVADGLEGCRRAWWDIRATVCLENRWARRDKAGVIEVPGARTPDAKQVREARYDPEACRLVLALRDGTVLDMRAGSGMEGG